MRSLFTGVSGLKTHQQKMDVIAHNISNVNTVAYKSSRTTFSEFFSQTIGTAAGANDSTGRGGTNPMQVGLGVSLGSIDVDMTSGAAQRTNRPLDLMVSGDGFFVVADESGQYFTRDGNFSLDAQGNLVNSSGLRVMGWDVKASVDASGIPTGQYEAVEDRVAGISISGEKTYANPAATENVKLTGNLNGTETPESITSIEFYDSVGNRWTQDAKLVWDATKQEWNTQLKNVVYLNGDRNNPYYMKNSGAYPDISGEIDGLMSAQTTVKEAWVDVANPIKFTNQGLIDTTTVPQLNYTVTGTNINQNAYFGDGSVDATKNYISGPIVIDFSDLTMFGNEQATASAERVDGRSSGTLTGMSVAADGSIVGQYSNGETRMIAKIPLAFFANPAGLEKAGNNLFQTTLNSGSFDGVGEDATSGGGKLIGGALEMSNVDLSSEFTEMITTQRGFQANSRTITTSDEMIQELVNLKR